MFTEKAELSEDKVPLRLPPLVPRFHARVRYRALTVNVLLQTNKSVILYIIQIMIIVQN